MKRKEIKKICDKYGILDYTINPDGSIDVNGGVNISGKGFSKLPLVFNIVRGDFYCYGNNLTTLKGSPRYVDGGFSCLENRLTSMEGCPDYIDGNLYARDNKIKTLEHFPNVQFNIYIDSNPVDKIEKISDLLPNKKVRDIFFKYQNHYDVWSNGFNESNFDLLLDDIDNGLL